MLAAIGLPNFSFEPEKKPLELMVEFAPPKEEPPPPPAPKPPEPVKPKVTPPKPVVQNTPKPVAAKSPEVAAPPPPPVIAAAPKAEAPPTFVAPVAPPEPPKPTVNQADVDNAKNQYGNLLSREVAKHKQYPKIAQMRGWQGDVELDLQIDGSSGNLIASKVRSTSGFEALDKQALEMVKKAAPFPLPPEALRAKTFNVIIPVSFKLE